MSTINPFAGPATEVKDGDEVKIIPPRSVAEAEHKQQTLEADNERLRDENAKLKAQVKKLTDPPAK